MLALSTRCRADRGSLVEAWEGLAELEPPAVALHRPPRDREEGRLRPWIRRAPVAAVFDAEGPHCGCRLVVVEGGLAAPDDRETTLEELCRVLHGLRKRGALPALRTARNPEHHPAPEELELVREAVPGVGYWHDLDRGRDAFLDAGIGFLAGASFQEVAAPELRALRGAVSGTAVLVYDPGPGLDEAELRESWREVLGLWRLL